MKNTYKDSFLVINGEFMQSQRNETWLLDIGINLNPIASCTLLWTENTYISRARNLSLAAWKQQKWKK